MKIRLMRETDADVVRRIDVHAFDAWWKQLHGESAELPQRTREHVVALREKEPDGCFVAEDDGRDVGFIFSRTWGGVGWFGTFGVMPERRGRGVGKALVAASVDYLRRDPGRVIGLETMPETPYNLGLYLKRDFNPRFLTLLLSKELKAETVAPADVSFWSQEDDVTRNGWLADLREATDRIYPRLDYTKEIVSTERHGFGKTLVLTSDSKAIGMSIVWLVSGREEWHQELATIQVLALHPDYADTGAFRTLIDASEALACAHGKQFLALPANARHTFAVGKLLDWGYKVGRSMVRMVLKGTDEGPSMDSHVNLSRWAG